MANFEARAKQNSEEAKQYLEEAKKKLNSWKGFLRGLFGDQSEVVEAIELYEQAGIKFCNAKKWSEAGNAFIEAAKLHRTATYRHYSAWTYERASICFKRSDPNQAINSLLRAIEIYTEMGRFYLAAEHHITVAEIYESDIVDIEKAITHYEQAADYYKGEEATTSANRCLLSVARYAAQLGKYQKAIEIYEEVTASCVENSLPKYPAKEYLFRSALCHMCVDLLNSQIAIKKYEEMYINFTDSRESKFLKTLLDKLEESDVDGFSDAVAEYDSISRLDPWFTNILLRIKKSINREPDLQMLPSISSPNIQPDPRARSTDTQSALYLEEWSS